MSKKQPMSIAATPELHEEITRFARRKGLSTSAYITDIMEQVVKLNIDDEPMIIGKPIDEDVLPVVLKIPTQYRKDPSNLEQWLTVQMQGIVKAMSK